MVRFSFCSAIAIPTFRLYWRLISSSARRSERTFSCLSQVLPLISVPRLRRCHTSLTPMSPDWGASLPTDCVARKTTFTSSHFSAVILQRCSCPWPWKAKVWRGCPRASPSRKSWMGAWSERSTKAGIYPWKFTSPAQKRLSVRQPKISGEGRVGIRSRPDEVLRCFGFRDYPDPRRTFLSGLWDGVFSLSKMLIWPLHTSAQRFK